MNIRKIFYKYTIHTLFVCASSYLVIRSDNKGNEPDGLEVIQNVVDTEVTIHHYSKSPNEFCITKENLLSLFPESATLINSVNANSDYTIRFNVEILKHNFHSCSPVRVRRECRVLLDHQHENLTTYTHTAFTFKSDQCAMDLDSLHILMGIDHLKHNNQLCKLCKTIFSETNQDTRHMLELTMYIFRPNLPCSPFIHGMYINLPIPQLDWNSLYTSMLKQTMGTLYMELKCTGAWIGIQWPSNITEPLQEVRREFINKVGDYYCYLRRPNGHSVKKLSDLPKLHSTFLTRIPREHMESLSEFLTKLQPLCMKIGDIFFSKVHRYKDRCDKSTDDTEGENTEEKKQLYCLGVSLQETGDGSKLLKDIYVESKVISECKVPYENKDGLHISVLYFEFTDKEFEQHEKAIWLLFNHCITRHSSSEYWKQVHVHMNAK